MSHISSGLFCAYIDKPTKAPEWHHQAPWVKAVVHQFELVLFILNTCRCPIPLEKIVISQRLASQGLCCFPHHTVPLHCIPAPAGRADLVDLVMKVVWCAHALHSSLK
jgi:hypothetical protein